MSQQSTIHAPPPSQDFAIYSGGSGSNMSVSSSSSSSPTTAGEARSGSLAPRQIQFEYDLSIHRAEAFGSSGNRTQKKRMGKARWLRHMKDWVAVSEPSAKAMKEEMAKTHRRHGADAKDARSTSRLYYPCGQLPEGIVTSTSGPRPEKAYRNSVMNNTLSKSQLPMSPTRSSLASSGSWAPSTPSIKESNPVAPWDN